MAEAQDTTEGGILLTGKAKIQKTEGTVVAVGPGRTHQDSGVVVEGLGSLESSLKLAFQVPLIVPPWRKEVILSGRGDGVVSGDLITRTSVPFSSVPNTTLSGMEE